jgi:hypothetical protein
MSRAILQERSDRLAKTFSSVKLAAHFPMLLDIHYDARLYEELASAMNDYILASLRSFNPGKKYENKGNILEVYREEVLNLPNRTPNGKMEPKKEIAAEFNRVERAIEAIFDTLKIDKDVELMQLPVSIRIQDGRPRTDIESRHYSTSKMHSDIWTGEPAVCGAVIVPVLGDVAKTGVEFYEPAFESAEEFVRVFDDYLDAKKYVDTAKRYDMAMQTSHLYVFDSYCLHKTLKNGGGMRASIDFRFTFKNKLKSDLFVPSERLNKYADLKKWHTAKNKTFIMPADSVNDTLVKFGKQGTAPKMETEFSLIAQGSV